MPYYNNYGNYPYGNSYQPQQPQFMQQNYNQQQPQQPQQQVSFLPLTFTSGLVGAKSYIVAPNQTVYLRDSDDGSNLLFEKSADMYGKYTLKVFELKEISIDDVGKEKNTAPKINYATKEEFESFKTQVMDMINPAKKESK